MTKAKKFFLLRERRETWRLRLPEPLRRFLCEDCGGEVDWLPAVTAALASGVTEREIFRLAEKGAIHFAESESGSMLVCKCSLGQVDFER